jgi:hypothetical protein
MEGEDSAERRPALTVSARAGFQPCGSGRRNGFPRRTKNLDEESKESKESEESEESEEYRVIVLDSQGLIQGLLGVHSRYGLHTRAVTNS